MLHTSTPLPDSFKDNGSGSLDRVEVRSLLKQLNKAVGVCEGLVERMLTSLELSAQVVLDILQLIR